MRGAYDSHQLRGRSPESDAGGLCENDCRVIAQPPGSKPQLSQDSPTYHAQGIQSIAESDAGFHMYQFTIPAHILILAAGMHPKRQVTAADMCINHSSPTKSMCKPMQDQVATAKQLNNRDALVVRSWKQAGAQALAFCLYASKSPALAA